MATRIIEYGNIGNTGPAYPVVPSSHQIKAQAPITPSGTSAQSAAVDDNTRFVLIQADEAIYAALGSNPTATTSDYRIQAGGEQLFTVQRGQSWKVAVRT